MNKFAKIVIGVIDNYWSILIGALALIASSFAIFIFKLGKLLPGLSRSELLTIQSSTLLESIINYPLYAPYRLLQFSWLQISKGTIVEMRSVSVFYAWLSILLFYYVVRSWSTVRVAVFGTILFATSAFFLHIGRLATPEILYMFSILLIIAFGLLAQKKYRPNSTIILGSLIFAFMLYVPGMIWFVLAGVLFKQSFIRESFSKANIASIFLGFLILLTSLLPLGYAIQQNTKIIKPILGIPVVLPSPNEIINNIKDVPVNLVFRGPDDPVRWLDRLPIIDFFILTMSVLGLYVLFTVHRKLDKKTIFIGVFIVGLILIGITSPISVSIFVPVIYILATSGIGLMLQQWFTVFPKNPFARSVGLSLIILVISGTVYYNAIHYFKAWPNAPETKKVFTGLTQNQ